MMVVSRETTRLAQLAGLVRKWSPAINLVAPGTLAAIETRHIDDSLQLVHLAASAEGTWLDIGSGGGFPGLVMAIARPDLAVILVESDARKCSFLRTAGRELELPNLRVLHGRIEDIPPQASANLSARALAPLPNLLSYVSRHLGPQGRAWLMKGRNWQGEVAQARDTWIFDMTVHPSSTDPDAAILEITGLQHV